MRSLTLQISLFISLLCLNACFSLPSLEKLKNETETVSSSSLDSQLRIWIPYVGQGDATLIELPNGKRLLIDAGNWESGQDLLPPFLKELGIPFLDVLIVTHYDFDHLGGVAPLLAGEDGQLETDDDLQVISAYDRGGEPWDNSPGFHPYLDSLQILHIPRITMEPGQRILLDSEVEIRCVAVNGVVYGSEGELITVDLTPVTFSGQENAASVALLIEFKDFRYLTAGDLTGGVSVNGYLSPDVESYLTEAVGEVDVVHVNHHGSLSSSNQNYVEGTSPEAVFIQAGIGNRFRHPAEEVVQRWEEIGAEVFSTEGGDGFLLTTDGENFEIETIDNSLLSN